jgi:hypothetical protein
MTPLVPKPLTSNSKADGRFDTRDDVKVRPPPSERPNTGSPLLIHCLSCRSVMGMCVSVCSQR